MKELKCVLNTSISELKGKILKDVKVKEKDQIIFTTIDDVKYTMLHYGDCCETVKIEDIVGDINDLIGSEILLAEESTNRDNPKYEDYESFTWTFYKLATIKGYVDIRWYGQSNGYYSESVDFRKEYYA